MLWGNLLWTMMEYPVLETVIPHNISPQIYLSLGMLGTFIQVDGFQHQTPKKSLT